MDSFETSLRPFPPGDNSSDTFIDGRHWNLTAFRLFGYGLYSNHTLSNSSSCYVFFSPWDNLTVMSSNGTFHNSTSCFSPILPMQRRAKISLGFAALFGIAFILAIVNLAKHGKEHVNPREKRFNVFRRRLQWYWMIVVAASGLVCAFTAIDVDRYYLPETPLVITSVFYFLMLQSTLALVWESTWHWASWLERRAIEEDPWSRTKDNLKQKLQFWSRLIFYLLIVASAVLLISRSWSDITKQRDAAQMRLIAQGAATGLRGKIGAFLNFAAWLIVVFSVLHSTYHYRPRGEEIVKRLFTVLLALVMIGYEAACAFVFDISPLKYRNPNLGMIYGLGWSVIVVILFLHGYYGITEPNEDEELKRLRREKFNRRRASTREYPKPSAEEDGE